MGAIQPEQALVYIGDVDVAPSAIASHSATFSATSYITNFSESGGEEDVESNAVFGGGFIDKDKPRTQIEVSFDVILQYGANSTKFDEFKWGSGLTSATGSPAKSIAIQFTDSTNYYTRVYNNCKAVTFEPSSDAENYLEGTITFKLSPTTSAGVANLKVAAAALSTLGTWS